MNGIIDFFAKRQRGANEFYSSPGATKTILVSSYFVWTEMMAHALLKLGYNVLVTEPLYFFWTNDDYFNHFDSVYAQWLGTLKEFKVDLILSGNSTAMVPHVKTKEPLHRAAGVPLVNFWWDEVRIPPPMSKRGLTGQDYLAALKDDRTLNIIWDADVCEELRRFLGLTNVAHVPLATSPEFWETQFVPLEDRPSKLCFLGHNHMPLDWQSRHDPSDLAWAKRAVDLKLADLDKSMADCVDAVGTPGETAPGYRTAPTLEVEYERWNTLGLVLMERIRNATVLAAAEVLGDDLVLIGQGWDRLGIKAQKAHTGFPDAKEYYAAAKVSLNLFGGCVHGGMPMRPFETASSNGLIFSQYNRELPDFYDLDKECVAFRNIDQMKETLSRILTAPQDYNAIVHAGRERTRTHHTWEARMRKVMKLVNL